MKNRVCAETENIVCENNLSIFVTVGGDLGSAVETGSTEIVARCCPSTHKSWPHDREPSRLRTAGLAES